MTENTQPEQSSPAGNENEGNTKRTTGSKYPTSNDTTRRPNRYNNRYVHGNGTTPRDFVGDTPEIGGILGLRS